MISAREIYNRQETLRNDGSQVPCGPAVLEAFVGRISARPEHSGGLTEPELQHFQRLNKSSIGRCADLDFNALASVLSSEAQKQYGSELKITYSPAAVSMGSWCMFDKAVPSEKALYWGVEPK